MSEASESRWAQGREGSPDSPLVVRLPEGKTGEGLVLSGGPAEGVLGSLIGEPWATEVKFGPMTQKRRVPSPEPAA